MHASARYTNIERTVLAHLVASSIPAPIVPVGDVRFNSADVASFVRVQFQPMPETYAGRIGGSRVSRARVLVVAECYCRDASHDEGSTIDRVAHLADTVADALRFVDLPLVDHVGDGSNITGVAVRFIQPPRIESPPPSDGWARRIVSAEGTWFLRHTEE